MTVFQHFQQVVARAPAAVAIQYQRQTCTYGELELRAAAVARRLEDVRGPEPRAVIVLLSGDPVAEIAAILGVISAGATAVPVDASQPATRLARIVDHSRSSAILAPRHAIAHAKAWASGVDVLAIPDQIEGPSSAPVNISPDTPAYVCYTSGSTGEPKGLVSTHRRILHRVGQERGRPASSAVTFSPDDRHTLLHSLAAAAGYATLWRALLSGGALLPRRVSDEGVAGMREWLEAERASVLFCSPTLFRTFIAELTASDRIPTVRVLRLVGERVTAADFARFKRHFLPGARFVNAYSITEAGNVTVHVLTHDSAIELHDDVVPVGRPLPGYRVTIIDEDGDEVPASVNGEIVVESAHLARSVGQESAPTRFKTGDLGRVDADGVLVRLGRRDFQVKVRGFRVELEGVETVLLRAPGVTQSAALVRQTPLGDSMLVACVAADRRITDATKLREFSAAHLPVGSVPSQYVLLDALPLTISGKVDRRALAALLDEMRSVVESTSQPSQTPIEQQVAAIWRELLGHARFGSDETFLNAGGDSLLAMRAITLVREQLGVDIALREFLRAPSVAALSARIERQQRDDQRADENELARLLDEIEGQKRDR